MSFNIKRAKELALKSLKSTYLELLLLGHSGSGKSYSIGTLGQKTLYLYGKRESHGPKAATTLGGDNIEPLCFDRGIWGSEKDERDFTPDESYKTLETVLKDHAYLKSEGYKAIVIDGLSVLEAVSKDTGAWKERCKTASGKHNTYKETEASQEIMGNIVGWAKGACQEIEAHLIVTGILDVKDKDQYGAVTEATPRLGGYGLAESMIQHFGDVVVVGKMSRGGEVKYKFQFMSDLVKIAKDEHGSIRKAMNYNPRLTGVANVPATLDADLGELVKLKATRK